MVTLKPAQFDLALYERLRISAAADVRDAAILLRDIVREASGLHVAATHNVASATPMHDAEGEALASTVFFAAGTDRWWLRPQLALESPLVAACRVMAEPFWCNAEGIYVHGRLPINKPIDLGKFVERAHTKAAIVVPVHLPFGQVAAASLLANDAERDDLQQEFDASAEVLAIYIRRFITSYVDIMQPHSSTLGSTLLTRREVECLRWASVGKTNDDIGIILGLSRATVRFHIRNASRKLDAVNRDQTVFKAAQLGYLSVSR